MVLDIQTVHHILKNTAVQSVNKPLVYITDLTSTLKLKYLPSWNVIVAIATAVTFCAKIQTL
jgi:hypothetical protein